MMISGLGYFAIDTSASAQWHELLLTCWEWGPSRDRCHLLPTG
ncbi:MAG: hypothetical protein CM15mP74_09290 [Halieaceae bacterium]|nr:MAG: hypothetical protein CM15mP74_09290 [Halieaceae bacterium]